MDVLPTGLVAMEGRGNYQRGAVFPEGGGLFVLVLPRMEKKAESLHFIF